jgi:hypothetical protein
MKVACDLNQGVVEVAREVIDCHLSSYVDDVVDLEHLHHVLEEKEELQIKFKVTHLLVHNKKYTVS